MINSYPYFFGSTSFNVDGKKNPNPSQDENGIFTINVFLKKLKTYRKPRMIKLTNNKI